MSNDTINLDIWPQERDIISRPDRIRYIRQLKSDNGECVFCSALNSGQMDSESLVLFKNSLSMVMLNKYPYNIGHLLVLPLRHEGDLEKLSSEEIRDTAEVIQKCVSFLKLEYKCDGLNIGLNHGRVAGAGIPQHIHWHIIPRWAGDTNFFPLIAETKVHPETLETTYQRLERHFQRSS